MKKFLIPFSILSIILFMSNTSIFSETTSAEETYKTEFCEGFEDGHCEGWRDVKGQYALCPLTPLCPLPKLGQSSDSYRDGYNTGFKRGMRDARK